MEIKLKGLLDKISSLPFKEDVFKLGGMIYAVGGGIRDAILDKESKDLDIMITGIEYQKLLILLEKYGKVDVVGESFGIIKYKEFGSTEDIDISLPRKETATGERGHKAFEVTTDPFLPIEEDLIRRDFTMNSIALSAEGVIIDPFNGISDIENKIIHYTNADAFFEDPLRMLRAVQFSSRFGFRISDDTFSLIKENAYRIRDISSERILIELTKIPEKGDPYIGAELLMTSGLGKYIFSIDFFPASFYKYGIADMVHVKTVGEFIFQLWKNLLIPKTKASSFWKEILNGDTKTYKEICALEEIQKYDILSPLYVLSAHIFRACNIYPNIINTNIWEDSKNINIYINKFRSGEYPQSIKELTINGNDLIDCGYSGIDIGDMFSNIIKKIFKGELKNEKSILLNYISK